MGICCACNHQYVFKIYLCEFDFNCPDRSLGDFAQRLSGLEICV